jgi:preprotein translocase subunit SecE
MSAGMYKQGQGYWTRMMSAVAGGLIVFMGAVWLWDTLAGVRIGPIHSVYVQAGAAVLFLAVLSGLGYYLICRSQKVGDFLIATEGEMKKVNWSTRREIMASTWVVIGLTFVVAMIIGVLDLTYTMMFKAIGVLERGG